MVFRSSARTTRSREFERFGYDEIEAPFRDVLASDVADAWYHSPTSALQRIGELTAASSRGFVSRFAEAVSGRRFGEGAFDRIDPEEYAEKYGHLGLAFDGTMTRAAADIIISRKEREIARRDAMNRARTSLTGSGVRFLATLGATAVDPLNVASAFIPVVGEARYASLIARFGPTRARLLAGAAEGAVGAAVVEPLVLGAARQEQADYTLLDSLVNVAFGTVLGGGLHVGVGAISDRLGRLRPATREAAMRGAIGQILEGRPVDVVPILRADPGFTVSDAAATVRASDLEDGAQVGPARVTDGLPLVNEPIAVEGPSEATNFAEVGAATREVANLEQKLAEAEQAHRQRRLDLVRKRVDDATADRLAAVEEDLAQPVLPRARRRRLERERTDIIENVRDRLPSAALEPEDRIVRGRRKSLEAARRKLDDAQALDSGFVERRAASPEFALEARRGIDALIERTQADAVRVDADDLRSIGEVDAVDVERIISDSEEALNEEVATLEADLQSMVDQGALTPQELAGIRSADDIDAQVKAHEKALGAVRRCLVVHP